MSDLHYPPTDQEFVGASRELFRSHEALTRYSGTDEVEAQILFAEFEEAYKFVRRLARAIDVSIYGPISYG